MNIVAINNLTKIYHPNSSSKVEALNKLNLEVKKGEIFGLLGPNGAGKTTLIKILLGITNKTSGEAKILGSDIKNHKIRSKIGYLPENHKFPLYLSGEDVMNYFAQLSGYTNPDLENRISELLEIVKLTKWRKKKVKTYSKGMMQRLGLAQAMVNRPELIFLDEPTDGVDPIGRKEIRDILLSLKNEGTTIFLNSHLLSEIELISDRVAILNKGKLIKLGTVEELTIAKEVYDFKFEKGVPQSEIENALLAFNVTNLTDQSFTVQIEDNTQLNNVIDSLRKLGLVITSSVPRKNSLEDMFISLINQNEGGENE